MGKIIGIDLGTSNSAAGAVVGTRCVIIPAAEGLTAGGKAFPRFGQCLPFSIYNRDGYLGNNIFAYPSFEILYTFNLSNEVFRLTYFSFIEYFF